MVLTISNPHRKQKCYNKNMGPGKEVIGLMKKYLKNPTKYMKVIPDVRNDSSIAREMIIASDLVVGYTSMMLLEGIVMGKPIVHVKFEQCSNLFQAMDFSVDMHTIYKPEEMGPALDLGLNTDQLVVKDSEILKYCLYKIDGKFCERLCTEIKKVVG